MRSCDACSTPRPPAERSRTAALAVSRAGRSRHAPFAGRPRVAAFAGRSRTAACAGRSHIAAFAGRSRIAAFAGRSRIAAFAALAVVLAAVSLGQARAQPAAEPPTLDALLEAFRSMRGFSAQFVEEKRVALLAVPLRSEGEVHFTAPGTLIRRVAAPAPSVALIDGGRLTMLADGRRQDIDLASNPVVAGFVSSFADVLAGDRAALERRYRVAYQSDGARWRLTLRPRGAPLDQFLREMVLEGNGRSVRTMRMVEASGDETVTTFREVQLDRRFSEAERRRIFRLD